MQDKDLSLELVRDLIKEKRSDRRWKNIRFFIGFLFLLIVVLLAIGSSSRLTTVDGQSGDKGYAALIRLEGMISAGSDFSAENVLPLLTDAFSDTRAKGVVLVIDSGGGTPVQASIIHDAILDLKKKYHKKVIVVGEDLMASGAYYVAVAADKIYVNPNTITGSIGVIMKGFGFPEAIKKIGVERRVITAGVNKDRLDPFLPQTPDDIHKIRQVIDEVHHNFIDVVRVGRQGKLKGAESELFSGDFWSGESALKLGLVDGLGNLSNVLHDEFHVAAYKEYSQSASLKNLVSQFGASMAVGLNSSSWQLMEKM